MHKNTQLSGTTQILRIGIPGDPFVLEEGRILPVVTVAYEIHGKLNDAGDNVILICHALTGDAHAAGAGVYPEDVMIEAPLLKSMKPGQAGWWDGMIGPGKTFDTNRYFVICSNILGSLLRHNRSDQFEAGNRPAVSNGFSQGDCPRYGAFTKKTAYKTGRQPDTTHYGRISGRYADP